MAAKHPNPAACAHNWQAAGKGRLVCAQCHTYACPGYQNEPCSRLTTRGHPYCASCRQRRRAVRQENKAQARAAFAAAVQAQAAQTGYDLLEYSGENACRIPACRRPVKTFLEKHPFGLCSRCLPIAFPEYAAALVRIKSLPKPPREPASRTWTPPPPEPEPELPTCPALRKDGEPCQARPNSRGYCGVHRDQAPETCNLKELKARGWTPARIRQILGEPDLLGTNPIYKTAAPTRLYLKERVQAAEGEQAAASAPPPPGLPAGQKPLLPDFPPTPNS